MGAGQLIVVIIVSIIASACGASESAIQTALAETAAANPTETRTPTVVPTITPTYTLEPTLSPTPDMRVLNVDPRKLLLEKDDLPPDARYYIPASNFVTPHRNSEIVSGWGVEEGREYLEKTGRVDGWLAYYWRGTSSVLAPEEVHDNVILYRTIEGSQLVLTKFSFCLDPEYGYSLIDTDIVLGDGSIICQRNEMQPGGENRTSIRLEFAYRNIIHNIYGWGWEYEVDLSYLISIAETLLAKAETFPLSDKVTFAP